MLALRQPSRWTSHLSRRSLRAPKNHANRRIGQRLQRRTYANEGGDGGHATHKSGSDVPWAIASVAVTVPATWYLLQPQLQPKKSHGGHGHDSHSEEGEHEEHGVGEGEKGAGSDSEPQEQEPSHGEASGDSSDSSESSEGEQETPPSSDDEEPKNVAHEKEGGGNVEGVQFKGATNATEKGEQEDTRKHIPDAKGFNKKRIESAYGNKQGEATKDEQSPQNEDMEATAKPAGDMSKQSGKQEGLSNTDTKHSTDVGSDPDKSSKADGTPETAKLKGTVDPGRQLGS